MQTFVPAIQLLDIATGRSRAWMNKAWRPRQEGKRFSTLDELGLSIFGQSAAGTSTKHGRTKVNQITMNYKWNNLANSSDEVQTFYVGVGPCREKILYALLTQHSPIALFFHRRIFAQGNLKHFMLGIGK